jgi:hypothetical protein
VHGPSASYTITAPVSTLVVDGGAGKITVTGSDRRTVLVTEHLSYSKTPPGTSRRVSGSTLTLSYTCPLQVVCGVAYDVQVPRGVAVTASNRVGSIVLASLAGKVTAKALVGVITASGLACVSASLDSGAGNIDAGFAAPPGTLRASTRAGAITIRVPGTVSYDVSTHAYVGKISVTVARDSSSPHAITASTDVGGITIAPS